MNSLSLSQPEGRILDSIEQRPAAAGKSTSGASLDYIAAPDGHRIPVRHWPLANPRAVVRIAHGMSEHSGCYEDIAPRLNAAGYAVISHDHRCHGASVPQAALGNVSASQHWANICSDMFEVNQHARRLYPNTPLALLGHSMGSFISLDFTESHSADIDVLMLEGTNYEPSWFCRLAQGLATFECWRQGEQGRSAILHALSFGGFNKTIKNPRTDYDWISRDEAFVDRYAADPLCGFQCSNGYWRDFLGGLAVIYKARNMALIRPDLPIYLFAGSADPVGHNGKRIRTLAQKLIKAGVRKVDARVYEGARHDILHETNADEIIHDLLTWLDKALPARQ